MQYEAVLDICVVVGCAVHRDAVKFTGMLCGPLGYCSVQCIAVWSTGMLFGPLGCGSVYWDAGRCTGMLFSPVNCCLVHGDAVQSPGMLFSALEWKTWCFAGQCRGWCRSYQLKNPRGQKVELLSSRQHVCSVTTAERCLHISVVRCLHISMMRCLHISRLGRRHDRVLPAEHDQCNSPHRTPIRQTGTPLQQPQIPGLNPRPYIALKAMHEVYLDQQGGSWDEGSCLQAQPMG